MTGGLKFSRRWFIGGGAAWCRGLVCGTAIWSLCGLAHAAISDELAGALEPICGALAARRLAAPSGPAPEAADNSPAAIAYYLSKGLDGKLADATVLTNDSADEDKDVWLGDRMFRLPPKGWVAVSADGRAGSMNVRLNRQRFMAGWCDDYTVWVKDGKIGHGISGLRFASIYEWLRAKEDDEFRLAWTGRRIFDAELPFPDGVTFLPHGHYRAEVTSLPASMRFADASGKTVLEFAAPTNFAPPYVMHVGLSGRHNALVCVEQPNAAPKVADIVPMPLKTFDPSVQENLTKIRVKPVGGMGAVTMTQSAGLGQADVRFVTRGRECRPYVEDGRVFFTFSARYNSTHLGVGSIDPTRPEDGWRFEGTILFDYGDGRYANDVAAHLWLDDESGEWRAWTSNFSTAGRDADGKPVKRAPGGISVAVSKTSPLHGFSVMRSRTLGLSGMNEDPSGCWDARAKKWRLLVSAFTPNGIKAQMLESDRWDGGFKALTGTVPEDSTGTTIARMNGDFACLAGSVDRAYYVYSYPMLAKLGTLTMDKTPWGEKTGWPHGRGWPAYLEVEKGGVLHKLLLTMDRENYPGMPNPNWTYGALFLYRAGELVACPVSGGSGEVVLQAKPAKGHLQDVCFDGKESVYWAHTREIYKTNLSGCVLAKATKTYTSKIVRKPRPDWMQQPSR